MISSVKCLNEPHFKVRTMAGLIDTGAPGWLITLRSFKPICFEVFRLRTGPANIFEGWCQNCGQFWENLIVWQLEFTSFTFPIIPATSYRLSAVRRPGQLPDWPACLFGRFLFRMI